MAPADNSLRLRPLLGFLAQKNHHHRYNNTNWNYTFIKNIIDQARKYDGFEKCVMRLLRASQ